MSGEFGENLSIKADISLLQHSLETRVGETLRLEEGIDANLPKAAEVTLLVAAVSEGVGSGVSESLLSLALLLRAAEAKALGLTEHVSS